MSMCYILLTLTFYMKAEEELSQEECHQGIYMEDIKITF